VAVDVSVPETPIPIAHVDTPGGAAGISLAGSTAFVADGAGGLSIVRLLRDQQTTVITFAGGSMATDDGSIIAIFPAGAFTTTVALVFKRLAVTEDSNELLGIGQPFEFKAASIASGQPVGLAPGQEFALVLRYSDFELGTALEQSLRMAYRNNGLWLPEPSSQVHILANALTALPRRLGWWNGLGPTHRRYLPLL
jgi:hypothetical protein